MIIIIGGGIIGLSCAYYLGETGITDVTLIEKDKLLGTGVTQYCSGGIRSQFTTPINVRFSIEALKEIKNWDIGFKKYGYLILDMEEDSKGRVEMQNSMGVSSQYLTPSKIKEKFLYVNVEGVISGSFHSEDGIADPSMLMSIYEKGAKGKGVRFKTETEIKKIVKKGDRVIGIETVDGLLSADTVILAAGPQSKDLGKTIGIDIPIVNRRKYVLSIEGFDFDFPLIMEIPTGWYIKKEGEDVLVGMSGKEEKVDYEKQQEAIDETIEASIYRFPMTEKSGIKKILSSLSDETPDKHAIIDNSIPGLIIATGFSGHGFMHSPAAGKIVASLVKGEKPIIDVSELKLHRRHIKEVIAI